MENFDPNSIRLMVIENTLAGAIAGLHAKKEVAQQIRALRDQLQAEGLKLPAGTFRLLDLLEPDPADPAPPPPASP